MNIIKETANVVVKDIATNAAKTAAGQIALDGAKSVTKSVSTKYKVIGVTAVVVIGLGAYKVGYEICENKYKPIVEDLEIRVKKLEKRANV